MPKCIKCDWRADYDEAFGACKPCGVNRGWFKGQNAVVGCKGCRRGYSEWRCPKCGHIITGNDLLSNTSDDILDCIILVLVILFVFALILARIAS